MNLLGRVRGHNQRVAAVSAVLRGFFWRWSSYNNFALDRATVAACPIQIDYVRLSLGYRA